MSTNTKKTIVKSENSNNVLDVVHWFNIKVIDNKREIVEFISWSGMKWELRLKYDWYFKYRAALLQVKYPKFEVKIYWGNEPATGKNLEEIKRGKIRAKKSKLTELIVTDTIPMHHNCAKIRVLTVADLFSDVIRRLVNNESISSHFVIS
jgi:hypothetical protein